jgi:acyl-CoA synthetase (NDP forming)
MSIWDSVPRESGSVAFISQSGGHCLQITSYAAQYGIRFSKVISFGNGTVLDSTDFLEYLANDSETEIISLYIEGVRDGRRLLELVRDVNRVKPVIILKGGGTKPGSRAVASHTGSLAGDTAIWDAFFKQTGAVRVDYLDELVEVISAFSHLRPPRGNRVAVILGGGGYGVVAADSFAREGLDVPILDNETRRELSHIVPAAGSSVRNPLDIAIARYDLRLLQQIMEIVGRDPQIDIFVITYALEALYENDSEQMHKLGPYICKFATEIAPHLAVVAVPDAPALSPPVKAEQRRLENVLPECGVPVYRTIPRAARALAKFAAYYKFQNER